MNNVLAALADYRRRRRTRTHTPISDRRRCWLARKAALADSRTEGWGRSTTHTRTAGGGKMNKEKRVVKIKIRGRRYSVGGGEFDLIERERVER